MFYVACLKGIKLPIEKELNFQIIMANLEIIILNNDENSGDNTEAVNSEEIAKQMRISITTLKGNLSLK